MSFDPGAFMEEFRSEATEHLQTLDGQLLQLERDPSDPRPIREMFLSAHTIKGGAAMLGLTDVRDLAHAMEDVLASLRDERQPLDPETADLLFRTLDMIRELVGQATPGITVPDPMRTSLAAALRQRIEPQAETTGPSDGERMATTGPSRPAAEARRVLLVEDSPTVRMLTTMQLSEAGFQVDAVADGKQALARALEEAYDLIVASIETQGLRGLELAATLRGAPSCRDLPIIVMSSDDHPEHRRCAAKVGVQAYIRKGSFGQRRLVETAREILARTEAPRRGELA